MQQNEIKQNPATKFCVFSVLIFCIFVLIDKKNICWPKSFDATQPGTKTIFQLIYLCGNYV